MDVSNVMFVCPKCNELTRLGVQRTDGKARRVCKNCEAVVDG
jgi:transcription elongation factor Elf1